jgi:hypothetical protein
MLGACAMDLFAIDAAIQSADRFCWGEHATKKDAAPVRRGD